MELVQLFELLLEEGLYKGIFSQPADKDYLYHKTMLRYIDGAKSYFQFEAFTKEQAFHRNVTTDQCVAELSEICSHYKQLHFYTKTNERIVRISKKGKVHITTHKNQQAVVIEGHNTKKNHLLQEGKPIDFLVHLGIMDSEGKVRPKWYDKFKQINRYLELIEDSLKHIDTPEPTIIDFGCGKSYLTFALYYYLVTIKKMNVTIIGLDLKEQVIHNLNQLTAQLGYDRLSFRVGDIAMFDYDRPIDMVISLHACNLATDYSIQKAINWNAKVIMAVPCCHKEINRQIEVNGMKAIFSYGVLKERMAALMTDGLRAQLMEAKGYETQVLEFVDMEHTPKNLMIRGYKTSDGATRPSDDYLKCCTDYGLRPTLEQLLFPEFR